VVGLLNPRDAPSLVPRAAILLAPLCPVLPTSTTKTPRRLTTSWKIKSLNHTDDATYFYPARNFFVSVIVEYLDTEDISSDRPSASFYVWS
jgi:hypothetical protein